MIVIFSLAGIVFLVFGISFIYRGYRTTPDASQVVPKKEFQKLESRLQSSAENETNLKKQLDTLAVDLEQTRGKLEDLEKTKEMVEALRRTEQQYTNKIHELEQSLSYLSGKADTQASEALSVIEQLTMENEQLKLRVEQQKEAVSAEDYEAVQNKNKALEDQIARHSQNIQDLQQKLDERQQKAQEELLDAQNRISILSNENLELKSGLEALRGKIEEVCAVSDEALQKNRGELQKAEDLIARLREENQILKEQTIPAGETGQAEGLQRQLDEALRTNRLLNETVASLKEQIQANEKTIGRLETENSRLQEAAGAVVREAPAGMREEWGQKRSQLENQVKILREFNNHLIEKERLLEFELSKSRAQAIGLEKLCAGMGMN